MLVLSACRTALGDLNAELGFAGLAVQSGAKAAVASLWSVDDAGTLLLMTNFYQHLKTSVTKAEALRQAQLAMLYRQAYQQSNSVMRTIPQASLPLGLQNSDNEADLAHPYYWAAFTMIGNPW
jgi:CHAT domain-containing protein